MFSQFNWVSEGINQNDPEYAAEVLNQPMPDRLALQLGAKKGTTYAEHWPNKTSTLKQQIRDGYTKRIDNELKNLESAGTTLETQFITEARKTGDLSSAQVNEYKAGFGELGLPIPSSVTNYETVTMRDQREDTQEIKALMASQNGYISNDQLDQFHPQAAVEFRDKASKLEKSSIAQFDGDKQISAALNTVFEGMGLKGNEKTLEYEVALANAKEDYFQKFNKKKIVKGFTTNPSLMRKAGAKDYKSYSKQILKFCKNKPISLGSQNCYQNNKKTG